MAAVLGKEGDAVHWNETINMENLQWHLNNGWNSSAFMYGLNGKGVAFGNIAPAAISQFPREWVVQMAEHWLDDSEKGFNTWIPLSTRARQDWFEGNTDFFITPGSSWYMIRPLYIHTVDRLANKFTLNHLKRFNMENGVPVAPETRKKDFTRSGDSYSNINAGKILLVLEGIGGLRYSVHDDSFTFADNLSTQFFSFLFCTPIKNPSHPVGVDGVPSACDRQGRARALGESSRGSGPEQQGWDCGEESGGGGKAVLSPGGSTLAGGTGSSSCAE